MSLLSSAIHLSRIHVRVVITTPCMPWISLRESKNLAGQYKLPGRCLGLDTITLLGRSLSTATSSSNDLPCSSRMGSSILLSPVTAIQILTTAGYLDIMRRLLLVYRSITPHVMDRKVVSGNPDRVHLPMAAMFT